MHYTSFCCERQVQQHVRLAQLDRASGYGPEGRGFESSSARLKLNIGDWSNGMIGVSKTFGGSAILSSPAK